MRLAAPFRGKPLALVFVAAVVFAGAPAGREVPRSPDFSASAGELLQLIRDGSLPGLRWPEFSNLRTQVERVYEQDGYAPLWVKDGRFTPRAHSVLMSLRNATEKGLNPEDYDVSFLLDRVAQPGWATRVDLGLTIALMRYAGSLHQGRIDPLRLGFAIGTRERLDPAQFVLDYLHLPEPRLSAYMASVEPPFRGYRRTEAALRDYLQRAAREPPAMPKRPRFPLRPGQPYADAHNLAARLVLLGDLTALAASAVQPAVYDDQLAAAVKHFQSRHGLAQSGVIDAPTWRAIATPLAQRVSQLALTLERWRWLPASIHPAIVVNIPEFELRAYNGDRSLALRMHVIVGKAYRHRTPVFEDEMESVIVRPYWNVPISIQRAEIVPALRRNPGYLAAHDMVVVDQRNRPVQVSGRADLLNRLASGELRLRQEPGPKNSLGLLKFNFPNSFDVYMHGTPAQQLFSRARRDFSHGCIRVEDPVALAEWVLREQAAWPRDKIVAATEGARSIEILVRRKIAVLVLYGTAVAEDNGEVHFFDDLYGYDAELRKALTHGYPYPGRG
jgi:murein L,D-transpeptidase YcbB/YkuD